MNDPSRDYEFIPEEDGGNYYFESKIKLKCYKDRFISLEEEEELMDFATRLLTPKMNEDHAHDFIVRWAKRNGVGMECQIQARCANLLKKSTLDDGVIDEQEFESVVAAYRQASFAQVPDEQIRIKLKSIMRERGWKAKKDGLFRCRWYAAIPS